MQARRITIRFALAVFVVLSLGLALVQGTALVIQQLGGAFTYPPEDAAWLLPDPAQKLIEQAYAGLDKAKVVDHNVILLSAGQRGGDDNQSFINADLLAGWHPDLRLRSEVLLSAIAVNDVNRFDDLYLARLVRLARSLPHEQRLQLAALDQRYDHDGNAQPQVTPVYVDNNAVWRVAKTYPGLFTPVVSVHPYRKDAVAALKRWAKRGVKTVKWMPSLQAIDPADAKLDAYYQALIDNHLVLLTQTGQPSAFGSDHPEYGNPLRYRRALKMGVHIIMAHSASGAVYPDPKDDNAAPRNGTLWFIDLLGTPDTGKNLYGDISGISQRGRAQASLAAVLQHPQIFEHLLYASAYPLPAVNAAIDLDELARSDFISTEQVSPLRSIYQLNPLLFNFVLARTVRLPNTDLALPDSVFTRTVSAK